MKGKQPNKEFGVNAIYVLTHILSEVKLKFMAAPAPSQLTRRADSELTGPMGATSSGGLQGAPIAGKRHSDKNDEEAVGHMLVSELGLRF
jgi:hypothetical protein